MTKEQNLENKCFLLNREKNINEEIKKILNFFEEGAIWI